MFRRAAFSAVAALTVGVLAVGCNEDGDTIVSGASSIRPDAFPGSSVDTNNLAEDGRAFTPSGQNVTSSEVFWNVTTGDAVVIFTTDSLVGTQRLLFASLFRNGVFTAPVQIRGQSAGTAEDPGGAIGKYEFLWLNTQGSTDADALEKNGDGILVYVRSDVAPSGNVTTGDEGANDRAWYAQFDASAVGANTGTFVNGFNTIATPIDTDNQVTGGNDPSVDSVGFSSTSLVGSHEFDNTTNGVTSGQPTTAAWVLYRKDQSSGATVSGPRWMAVQFLLNEPGSAFSTSNVVLNPAAGTISAGDNTAKDGATDTIVVHNEMAVYEYEDINDTDQDDSLTAIVLPASGTPGAGISLGSAFPTAAAGSNDDSNLPRARDVYGDDHGLTSNYIFFRESGFGGAVAEGNRANDEDLMLAKIDRDANGVLGTTRELQEVDAFTANVDLTGTDDAHDPVPGDRGTVFDHETRINRTGQYITLLLLQNNTDQADADDASAQAAALNLNRVLRVRVIQTRRDSTARTIANSVSTAVQSASQTATGFAAAGTQADVSTFSFQQDLANGQAVSQGGQPMLGCVFQSNHLRMNWTYQQPDDQQAVSTAEDNLLMVDGVNVTLGAAAAAPTITTVTNGAAASNRAIIARVDVGDEATVDLPFAVAARQFTDVTAVDAGDTTTTGTAPAIVPSATAGRVLVYYVAQGNNADSIDTAAAGDGVTGVFLERRLFVWDNGTSVTISSDPTGTNQLDYNQVGNNSLRVIQVPANEDIVGNPSWAGSTIHSVWQESISRGGNQRLAARAYQKEQTQATPAVTFGERFNPDVTGTAAAAPVFIDNPSGGDLNEAVLTSSRVFRSGSTVGVFFVEDEHLYYQEISSNDPATGYYFTNGVATPQLVDNESAQDLNSVSFFRRPACDDLNNLIVVMVKDEGASDDDRGLIRVRN